MYVLLFLNKCFTHKPFNITKNNDKVDGKVKFVDVKRMRITN